MLNTALTSACWVIQDVYGLVENEIISLGKARELTAAIIEKDIASQFKPVTVTDRAVMLYPYNNGEDEHKRELYVRACQWMRDKLTKGEK